MSRRAITPYIVAGATGLISGVYTFRPLFQEAAEKRKIEEESRSTLQLQTESDGSGSPTASTKSISSTPATAMPVNDSEIVKRVDESKKAH